MCLLCRGPLGPHPLLLQLSIEGLRGNGSVCLDCRTTRDITLAHLWQLAVRNVPASKGETHERGPHRVQPSAT